MTQSPERITNILRYLEESAVRCPDKIAFSDGEAEATFGEVLLRSRSIGCNLYKKGHCKQPVVVFMKKHPNVFSAFFGAIYAGCYYVPLDDEMPRHRIELILQTLDPGAMICDDTTEKIAAELDFNGSIYRYDDLAYSTLDAKDLVHLAIIRDAQLDTDPIYVVFTSGSTGVPKGVIGTHRAVIDYIENLDAVMQFHENTVYGNQTPLYFDACLKEIIPTIKHGATTILIPKKLFMFPVKLVEFLNEHKINTLCWVVSALTMISSFKTFDKVVPEYVQTIAFASEVFPIRQLNIWRKTLPNARFVNLYGPTETTGICCYYEVNRQFEEHETLPIGRPFRNTEILLLNEQNQRISKPGMQGEICVRGTRLTLGYYKNPEKTAEVFVQNPLNTLYPELIYRTGDLGRYNDRGELEFMGRKDYQIKHMGHRIELGEIEVIATMHEAVSSACCTYDQDTKRLVLHYVGDLTPADMTAYLKKKLPRYMIPNMARKLEEMPYTPNGKIDRKKLASA